jgi:acetyl-CoA carboxylase biotin carboxylase subunit
MAAATIIASPAARLRNRLACLRRALDEFAVEGIKTTIPLLRKIVSHSAFLAGEVDTTFIERTWAP